jgi:iron complex outermembrane recepter protein
MINWAGRLRRASALAGALALGAVCHAALAASADAAAPDAAAGAPATTLQEVVVTAERRATNIQTTPIAITAVNVSALQAMGVTDYDALQRAVPSLEVEQQRERDSTLPSIRGVKANEISPDLQKVITLYDGMPLLGTQSVSQMIDVDRVEVYRGPQSAEFGRSVFAGAINYVSRNASLTHYSGTATLSYGNDGLASGSGLLTGPLVQDKLGLLVAVHQDNYDGPGDITSSDGVKLGGTKTRYLAVKLNFSPFESLDGYLRFQHLDTYDEPSDVYNLAIVGNPQFVLLPASMAPNVNALTSAETIIGPVNTTPPAGAFDRNFCFPGNAVITRPNCVTSPSNRLNRDRYATNLTGKLPDGSTLTLQGFLSWEVQTRQDDNDRTNLLPYINTVTHRPVNTVQNVYNALTETDRYVELLWLSRPNRALRGHVGASYYWFDLPTIIDNNVNPNILTQVLSDYSRTSALYGQIEYDVLHNLTLSLEARLQRDHVIGYNPNPAAPGQPPLAPVAVTTDSFLPRFSMTYSLNPDLTVYGQVAEGDDPAGTNPDVLTPTKVQIAKLAGTYGQLESFLQYREEKLWNYELGVKGNALDHHLVFSADVYYLVWQNYQNATNFQIAPVGTYPSITTSPPFYNSHVTFNEGDLHGKGVELSAQYQPIDMLGLRLDYSHNDMHYVNACSPGIVQFGFATENGFPYPCVNVAGKDLPLIPHDTVSLGLTLTNPFPNGMQWSNRLEYYYLGPQYIDDSNLNWIPAKSNLDFFSTLLIRNSLSVTAFVKNITDNRIPTAEGGPGGGGSTYLASNPRLGGFAGQTGFDFAVAPPREYGVTLDYSF